MNNLRVLRRCGRAKADLDVVQKGGPVEQGWVSFTTRLLLVGFVLRLPFLLGWSEIKVAGEYLACQC